MDNFNLDTVKAVKKSSRILLVINTQLNDFVAILIYLLTKINKGASVCLRSLQKNQNIKKTLMRSKNADETAEPVFDLTCLRTMTENLLSNKKSEFK